MNQEQRARVLFLEVPMSILLALVFAAMVGNAENAGAGWRFVIPVAGDPFEHPPLRALVLADRKPEDVVEKVDYRGRRQRYAQLRYGSPSSIRRRPKAACEP